MTESTESEVDVLLADDRSSADLAAARLVNIVAALLEHIGDECDEPQTKIAEAMGVSKGRVSQLLNGDGNLRVSTLARILDACGFELSVTASPKPGHAGRPVSLPRPSRQRSRDHENVTARAEENDYVTWLDDLRTRLVATLVASDRLTPEQPSLVHAATWRSHRPAADFCVADILASPQAIQIHQETRLLDLAGDEFEEPTIVAMPPAWGVGA